MIATKENHELLPGGRFDKKPKDASGRREAKVQHVEQKEERINFPPGRATVVSYCEIPLRSRERGSVKCGMAKVVDSQGLMVEAVPFNSEDRANGLGYRYEADPECGDVIAFEINPKGAMDWLIFDRPENHPNAFRIKARERGVYWKSDMWHGTIWKGSLGQLEKDYPRVSSLDRLEEILAVGFILEKYEDGVWVKCWEVPIKLNM